MERNRVLNRARKMKEAEKVVTKETDTCPESEVGWNSGNDSVHSSLKRVKKWSNIVF